MLSRQLARLLVRRDRRVASRAEAERIRRAVSGSDPEGDPAERVLGPDGRPAEAVANTAFPIGTLAGDPSRVLTLERADVLESHSVTYGGTGAGKTVLWLSIAAQELRRMFGRIARGLPPDTAIMVIEPKHDLAPQFLLLLEHLLSAEPSWVIERVLANVTTFGPLGRFVVPIPILQPPSGVAPEVHAMALSNLVGRLSGSAFGPKQQPLLAVILLCLHAAGLTLPEGVALLGDWTALRSLARQSPHPMVRDYFQEAVRVPSGLDGIRARLLRLVFTPNLRAAFAAREGLDFDASLAPGQIVIHDLGGSIGDEDLTDFFCGFSFGELSQAIRRRPNGAPPVIGILDEFQLILQGDGNVGERVAKLLQTARSRGVALHLLTQGPASVSAVSPQILSAVHTNVSSEILGPTDDVRSLAHLLPVTGRRPRARSLPWEAPPASPWVSRDEELRQLLEETQALPPRHFWVRAKRRAQKATLVRTLDFHLPPSRDPRLAERLERGRLGRTLAELEHARREDGTSARLRVVPGAAAAPIGRRRPRGL